MTQRANHAPQIARALLQQLLKVAAECSLHPWEKVHAVHVVDSLGQADDAYQDLSTPTCILRRKHLRRRYADDLRLLSEGPSTQTPHPGDSKAWVEELETGRVPLT